MSNRPLLVTADEWLLDHLLGLTARLGLDPDVAAHSEAARPRWPDACAVVVDARAAAGCASAALARRAGLVVVNAEADDALAAEAWQASVRLGAEEVVRLPEADAWLVRWLQDVQQEVAPEGSSCRVVTVAGTPGGAGATTFAAALAGVAHREGQATVLVDADPWGGGIDLLLGAEGSPGVRWPDLAGTSGRLARGALVPALPTADGLPVLAWDRKQPEGVEPEAFALVLDAVRRGGDLVVVDLGRGSPFTDVALGRSDELVLVALPRLRAAAAAGHLLARAAAADATNMGARTRAPMTRLVVRSTGRDQLDPLDLADALGLPLAGRVPRQRRRAEEEELGVPPAAASHGALARFCSRVVAGPDHRRAA